MQLGTGRCPPVSSNSIFMWTSSSSGFQVNSPACNFRPRSHPIRQGCFSVPRGLAGRFFGALSHELWTQNVMTPEAPSNEIDCVKTSLHPRPARRQSARCARTGVVFMARRIAKHCAGFFNHKIMEFAAALRALYSRAPAVWQFFGRLRGASVRASSALPADNRSNRWIRLAAELAW